MKALKLQSCSILFAALCMIIPMKASAQWSLGASYEIRDEDPKNGYGIRIERDILRPVPIVDIGLRAHFSYFSDDNTDFSNDGRDFIGDPTYYDYGLAATGGVSLGLLKPYIGLGIGNGHYDFDGDVEVDDFDDSNIYWNSFIGVELTPIPKLNPFVEYRFEPTDEADFAPSSNGRFIIGLSLSL